jgi:hypothetical protein
MYAAVPTMTPPPVAAMLNVGEFDNGEFSGAVSNAFASPKSSSLTLPSGVILMFAGLRSRCANKFPVETNRRIRGKECRVFADRATTVGAVYDRPRALIERPYNRKAM